jgi:microsomal dipeptidase-like Zn-dependent dipeptidase
MIIDALQCSRWDREVFQELRDGGLDCVVATVGFWEDARESLQRIGEWYETARRHADLIAIAHGTADAEAIAASGRTAILFGLQNTAAFEDSIALVEPFARLGVRVVQLTYNNQNAVGSSCYERNDNGLARFGGELVRELNRCGMLIDLSHVGARTSLDAIAASNAPVAITHAVPASFHSHPRNKSDEELRALADRGGVFGCAIYPPLIGGSDVPLERWTEMVARTVELIGVEHVGIGTDLTRKCTDRDLAWMRSGRWTWGEDFGAGKAGDSSLAPWPTWFRSARDFPALADGLRARGFDQEEVRQILGGNWLRLFEGVFTETVGRPLDATASPAAADRR